MSTLNIMGGTFGLQIESNPYVDNAVRLYGNTATSLQPWHELSTTGVLSEYVQNSDGTVINLGPVTNAKTTMTRDQWVKTKARVNKAAREKLSIYSDIVGLGLEENINTGFSLTEYTAPKMGDTDHAILTMEPTISSGDSYPQFDEDRVPLPIAHTDFSTRARQIATIKDVDMVAWQVARSAYSVAKILEDMVIGTKSFQLHAASKVYGLTTHPDRMTGAFTVHPSSVVAGTTKKFVEELRSFLNAMDDQEHSGPYAIWVSKDINNALDTPYASESGTSLDSTKTLREVLEKLSNVLFIRSVKRFPEKTMIILSPTMETYTQLTAQAPTVVQWGDHPFHDNYKTYAISVPFIRSDYYGRCGVQHLTTP